MEIPFKDIFKLEIFLDESRGISLNIPNKVNIISGKSGAGKSYICQAIKSFKHSVGVKSSIPLEDIFVWNSAEDVNSELAGKLIIIDRYPMCGGSKLDEFIKNSDNKFIVITHKLDNSLDVPAAYLYRLEYNGNGKFSTVGLYVTSHDKQVEMVQNAGWEME
jgi:hypothetical protein